MFESIPTTFKPNLKRLQDHVVLFCVAQELNRICRAMQQRIVELISCVSNEAVTEELLHVNDDLNNIFLRYDRLETTEKLFHNTRVFLNVT